MVGGPRPSFSSVPAGAAFDLAVAATAAVCVFVYLPFATYFGNRLECLDNPASYVGRHLLWLAALFVAVLVGLRLLRAFGGEAASARGATVVIGGCAALYVSATFLSDGEVGPNVNANCAAPLTEYGSLRLLLLLVPVAALMVPASRRLVRLALGGMAVLLVAGIAEGAVAYSANAGGRLGAPIGADTEILFTNATDAAKYLRGDALRPEAAGTWLGREASIVLPIAKPYPSEVRVTLGLVAPKGQVTEITVNGSLRAVNFPPSQLAPAIQVSQAELGRRGLLRIRLDSAIFDKPGPGDIRQRSLFLQSLRLERL